MKLSWVLVAGGVLVCLAAGLVFTVSAVEIRGLWQARAEVPASRRRRLGRPRGSRRFVRAGAAPLAAAGSGRCAETEAAGELGPGAKEPRPEKPEGISSAQYDEFVKTEFESQTPDPAWSRDAAFELTQTLLPLLENEASKATRVDCRRDLCRFEVRNRDENAYQKTFETALHQRVWNAGFLFARSLTEPTTMIVYFAKKGGFIPSPIPEEGP